MADIEEKAHALLSASGAHRWMNCAASVEMEKKFPRESSPYAEEGTLAHHFAELCLKSGVDARELIDEPGCEELSSDMARYIQEFIDYVRAIPGYLMVENRVDFSEWVPGGFGTADVIIMNDKTARVIDLKYGKGVVVHAENNEQGMLYALGAYYELSALYDIDEFIITIHMPRLDFVSEWTISVDALLSWADKIVDPSARAARSKNAPFNPGPKQCRFCGAKNACKALTEYNLKQAYEGFETIEKPGELIEAPELTPVEVSACMKIVDSVKSWANGVEAYAQSLLEQGIEVPGYKMVRGRNSRHWKDEEAAAKALTRKLTKKVAYTQKLLTPPAAEKILGKDSKIIKDHVELVPGKPTIAKESDRREAIQSKALEGFEVEATAEESEAIDQAA